VTTVNVCSHPPFTSSTRLISFVRPERFLRHTPGRRPASEPASEARPSYVKSPLMVTGSANGSTSPCCADGEQAHSTREAAQTSPASALCDRCPLVPIHGSDPHPVFRLRSSRRAAVTASPATPGSCDQTSSLARHWTGRCWWSSSALIVLGVKDTGSGVVQRRHCVWTSLTAGSPFCLWVCPTTSCARSEAVPGTNPDPNNS
jgi:hypothetical protein